MKGLFFRSFKSKIDKAEYYEKAARSNLRMSFRLVTVIIIFEVFLLLRALLGNTQPYSLRTLQYVSCYASLLSLSVIVLICSLAINKKSENIAKSVDLLGIVYCVGITIWAICLSILDSVESEQFVVYMTVVVTIVSALKLHPGFFLPLQILAFVTLCLAMFFSLENFDLNQIINLAVFTIVFLIVSIAMFNRSVNDFYNKKRIESQNEQLLTLTTLLKEEKSILANMAVIDQLTGLKNRSTLNKSIKGKIAKNQRHGTALGFAMFDLDDFKIVNDKYGHAVGDECLALLGECFQKHKQLDVYRYGGEEFLAICENISEFEFEEIIHKIIVEVSNFTISGNDNIRITISAGYVYAIPTNEFMDETLIAYADSALYNAKKSGKNCAVKAVIH